METFVELRLLNIFAFYSFTLSVIVFEILPKSSKNRQNVRLKATNSCKESFDNFNVIETFVELHLLIIFASYSFTLSVIVFEILAKNSKISQNLCLKANNSCKESSNNFGVMETFVEFNWLIISVGHNFSVYFIVLEI